MKKQKFIIYFVIFVALIAAIFVYPKYYNAGADYLNTKLQNSQFSYLKKIAIPHFKEVNFRLGLDLLGGTHLLYQADLSQLKSNNEKDEAMVGVKDVIERRVNLFGVTEPVVQTTKSGDVYRLIVELAGIKDINQAIRMIGETPYLDFREVKAGVTEPKTIMDFEVTGLDGRYLKKSTVKFDSNNRPLIELLFNDEGGKLFENLTEKNIGKPLSIFLDGFPISTPTVQGKISGGQASITGNFKIEEAKELVRKLNAGALPVPIKLVSQKTIGASLGEESLKSGLKSALYAFVFIFIFMILWYRLPGVLAILALLIYTVFVLTIFKLMPVTLTLAGIAGFILSVGMAVDANILIFARMKEEFRLGRSFEASIREGGVRAWPSIRDSNLMTILTSLVLYFFTTSGVKGFALILIIGVLVSMFTAIYVTRLLLGLFVGTRVEKWQWLWYR